MLKRFGLLFFIYLPLSLFSQVQFEMIGEPDLVVNEDTYFMQPVWSPDGSWIALSGSNYKELWVVKPDGSSLKRLSEEASAGFGIEWSADSREILTSVTKFEGAYRKNAIKVFNIEQSSESLVMDYAKEAPVLPRWTSDESQIYYYNGKNLEFINTGKQIKIDLLKPLYFLKNGNLYTQITADNLLASADVLSDQECLNVRISPDGKRISYEVLGGNLFVVNSDGSQRIDLGQGYRARWSPDSQYLVYMVTKDDGYEYQSSDIFISRIDGSAKYQVTKSEDQLEMNPCWSPDGNQIVYNEEKSGAIYIINIQR
jgi:Tol biopolymer transport system component